MTYEPDRPQRLKLGIAAKMAKRYGADQHDFFKSLPLMLEGSLPDETEIA
jgi:hypothetical protein